MTNASRTAWLEAQFEQVVAKFETEKGGMNLAQLTASVGQLARLSTGISQADAAEHRALKARMDADLKFLKIEAELAKALSPSPTPNIVEGDETDMDDEPVGKRDTRTAEQLRLEIKGRFDLLAGRMLSRRVPRRPDPDRTPAVADDLGLVRESKSMAA